MTMTSDKINFFVDTLIVEAICAEPQLIKKAEGSLVVSLINKAKQYFEAEMAKGDPNDRTGTMINLIAPTAISLALSSLGMPWIGFLFGLASYLFDFDIAAVLRYIYNGLKTIIVGDDTKIAPEKVDEIVSDAIRSSGGSKMSTGSIDNITALRDARVIKLALIQYSQGKLNKQANAAVAGIGAKLLPILTKVLGWIFKVALGTGGFLMLSGWADEVLGKKTSPSSISEPGASSGASQVAGTTSHSRSSQTKFKVNPSYNASSMFSGLVTQNYPNTVDGITRMVLDFAKQVYSGLNGMDSIIKSTAGFQGVVETIVWENHTAAGDPFVVIPAVFKSKKDIVDYFIDEVAAKTP